MPSKLRRAIDAVKDKTSISLARVSGTSPGIDVAVLRATTHDEGPIDDERVAEVLLLASSSPESAAGVARAVCRRLSRTCNWVVAVKSLCVVSRAISAASPRFCIEALAAANSGDDGRRRRLLDLSGFHDESGLSSPWDFTAFVRTLANYLSARLDSFAAGKLLRRPRRRPMSDLKPPAILDRIGVWQGLLDRAMGTRPTGPAKAHRLVHAAFYSVLRESFDLYRDISDGLSLLLDSFFHLSGDLCRETFRACVAAAKQFDELEAFYASCRKNGVGRVSEYPSIRKISDSLLETLEEFLADGQAKSRSSPKLLLAAAMPPEEEVPASDSGDNLPESDNWELALLESMNELSERVNSKSLREGGKPALEALAEQSPRKKNQPLQLTFHNPFLHAANDKRLMAVTPSPPSPRAPLEAGEGKRLPESESPGRRKVVATGAVSRSMVAANDRSLMAVTPAAARIRSEEHRGQRGDKAVKEEEDDPFEQLAWRERRASPSPAAREFRERFEGKAR